MINCKLQIYSFDCRQTNIRKIKEKEIYHQYSICLMRLFIFLLKERERGWERQRATERGERETDRWERERDRERERWERERQKERGEKGREGWERGEREVRERGERKVRERGWWRRLTVRRAWGLEEILCRSSEDKEDRKSAEGANTVTWLNWSCSRLEKSERFFMRS